jgi:hypothetical protein
MRMTTVFFPWDMPNAARIWPVFGVRMVGQAATRFEEFEGDPGFMPTIGLLAALAPAMAHAQTNLDQGKSASQIFSAACAECHKAPQGLAKGKSA